MRMSQNTERVCVYIRMFQNTERVCVYMSQNTGRAVLVLCIHRKGACPRIGTGVAEMLHTCTHTTQLLMGSPAPAPPAPHTLCSHTKASDCVYVYMSQNTGRAVLVLCIHRKGACPRIGTGVAEMLHICTHTTQLLMGSPAPAPPAPHTLCSHTKASDCVGQLL